MLYYNVYKDIVVYVEEEYLNSDTLGILILEIIKPCFSKLSSNTTPHLGQNSGS